MASTRDQVTKEYTTDEIAVEWWPSLCFHSEICVRSLPQVFDSTRRPWIQLDAAPADEIDATVARCPSGALRARRAGATIHPGTLEVRASENGPLLLRGDVRVLAADGSLLYEGERAALCRCGGSSNKPFCDGTHRKNGFRG